MRKGVELAMQTSAVLLFGLCGLALYLKFSAGTMPSWGLPIGGLSYVYAIGLLVWAYLRPMRK